MLCCAVLLVVTLLLLSSYSVAETNFTGADEAVLVENSHGLVIANMVRLSSFSNRLSSLVQIRLLSVPAAPARRHPRAGSGHEHR